jgi:hypothetical protein
MLAAQEARPIEAAQLTAEDWIAALEQELAQLKAEVRKQE